MEINLPTLQRGSTGEAVRFLQQMLIAFGFLDNDSFNAEFKTTTEQAVKQFKKEILKQSKPNGIVDRDTWFGIVGWTGNFCNQISP
jgi:N-acetyl-anhydromuramyl-L-alanine amidase AmpD